MKAAFRMIRNTLDFYLFTYFKDSVAFFLYFELLSMLITAEETQNGTIPAIRHGTKIWN